MPCEFAISSIKAGIIKIIVSKATEATSVMYREEVILSAISNAGIAANEIKMMVRPLQIKASPRATGNKVSVNASETVALCANEIGDNAISNAHWADYRRLFDDVFTRKLQNLHRRMAPFRFHQT